MKELVLIKLGGSLITDKSKPFTARENVISRLGTELLQARKNFRGDIIIGHGSGSFGHTVAAKYKTQEGIRNSNSIKGLSEVADAAVQINRIVIKNLIKVGLPVVSFSPTSFILAKNQKTKNYFIGSIKKALEIGIIPVVYGDIIFDSGKGFCIFSGEKILNLLAVALKDNYKSLRVIYCGDTDGVYDKKGKTIPKITSLNFKEFKKSISGSNNIDVTGGMLHKVEESIRLVRKYGIQTKIVSGLKNGSLIKAIVGKALISTSISS